MQEFKGRIIIENNQKEVEINLLTNNGTKSLLIDPTKCDPKEIFNLKLGEMFKSMVLRINLEK